MIFPKWANRATTAVLIAVPAVLVLAVAGFAYFISPYATQVGYAPRQPIPYSHKLHAGDYGVDCRYCHVGVERSAVAMVPPSETCMNCHTQVRKDSPNILPVKESALTGKPLEWVRVHKVPDFVYFDHSIHVDAGVGCVTCHGRIDQMEVVYQAKPLNMAWCLDCHRQPEKYLRPVDKVTDMNWQAANQLELGVELRRAGNLNPTTDCSGCHR